MATLNPTFLPHLIIFQLSPQNIELNFMSQIWMMMKMVIYNLEIYFFTFFSLFHDRVDTHPSPDNKSKVDRRTSHIRGNCVCRIPDTSNNDLFHDSADKVILTFFLHITPIFEREPEDIVRSPIS